MTCSVCNQGIAEGANYGTVLDGGVARHWHAECNQEKRGRLKAMIDAGCDPVEAALKVGLLGKAVHR